MFRNTKKIDAIIGAAQYVQNVGFDRYKVAILQDPITTLRLLPYIGEITSYHPAKNLGADVAKPDRHLARFASSQGFRDVHSLCSAISLATCDPVRVIDIVLWRFLVWSRLEQEKQSTAIYYTFTTLDEFSGLTGLEIAQLIKS